MISPLEKISEFIVQRPFLTGCFLIALIMLSFVGASTLSMSTETQDADKNAHGAYISESYKNNFQSDSIMLMVQADSVMDVTVVDRVYTLQKQMATTQGVSSVQSVYDVLAAYSGGTIPQNQASIDAVVAQIPESVTTSIMPNGQLAIILIKLDTGTSSTTQQSILNNLRSMTAAADIPPGVTLTFTGNAAMQQDMGGDLGSNMIILLVAAIVLMMLACKFLFNHVRFPLLSIVSVFTGLILTFGMMGIFGLPFSMTTIGAMPILLGIGVDYAIQFHSRLDDEMRNKHPLPEAIKLAVSKTGAAVFYAMIASALGFMAMMVSTLPDIRQFGITAILGIACCYVAALIIIPLAAVLTNYQPKPHKLSASGEEKKPFSETYNELLRKLAVKVTKFAIPIMLVLCIIGFTGVYLDEEVPVSTDMKSYVPVDMPAIVNINTVTRAMGDTGGFQVYVQGGELTSPDAIEWMYKWGAHELALYNTRFTSVSSIATVIVEKNGGVIPTTQVEIDKILNSMSEADKASYIKDGSQAVISFGMKSLSEAQQRSLVAEVTADVQFFAPPPGIEAVVTGSAYSFVEIMNDIREGKTKMTLLAFVIIFAFLAILYRSAGMAICPLVPIVLIIGWNGAAMYFFGIDYTILTATMGAMTIGVAAEYCIMMVERIYEEMEHHDTITAVQNGTGKIGTAITVSGCATMCGFSALMFSNFPIISGFGMVTVLAMGFTLFGAVVAVPATVSIVLKNRKKGKLEGDGEYTHNSMNCPTL
ncbi:efflux RND transporter permease subunit [Methanocorpusculum vombati]|uniref:Hydrophobe/amphiphile efflux-3 (HAE3) family transporter n=1 Tax=Methanocorpusculum vombati TaxID=3002864 RepID=A0ABT4IQS7_9EURY|nr:hydrophobe/amphiphile efflux-3 (HAE3) family transporter [Methanocorpusculum vombati]MCZ9320461.1 hydrophobe/amphiphile efflux-3 (HAE3) family transporter [Methanocorpusculum sp.]MDE2519920.1 hydrophobe/amphiphile efflux-3 (HAE3) family transporter [Methanocorpusculum sp.]MDE2533852.1 hydrophobe/amphiphile efflux-3 (HAE3) family transporter [Methanocorpusculum sp.]MDE2546094.1 hydrophobe/amphiphile efflux-3 (HAE3) family transporter [Methanocorpusculum sp.]